ncbi:MAG: hypothetical protein NZ767_02295, partial [SAR86 cluster bacterium]|nr:hypothetical protein [SAR86 cluster bacterium]
MEFQQITSSINHAFFRLEMFMKGSVDDYKYYGFNEAFTQLFIVCLQEENYTFENCNLMQSYWELAGRIAYDYDQGGFENKDAT